MTGTQWRWVYNNAVHDSLDSAMGEIHYFIAFCSTQSFTVGFPLESLTNKKIKANVPISFSR